MIRAHWKIYDDLALQSPQALLYHAAPLAIRAVWRESFY
jgi:hypothetical protein